MAGVVETIGSQVKSLRVGNAVLADLSGKRFGIHYYIGCRRQS
ncbi:MAG: hypothetical protein K0B14_09375 [Anaerolineaceae bacterium]|nr:hypothetical protein [Anaerolineaceae bacterium]